MPEPLSQHTETTRGASNDVVQNLAQPIAKRPLYALITALISPPITKQKLVELFERRATYGAITGWRYGRRNPPQWAVDLLRSTAERRAREILQYAANIEKARNRKTRQEHARAMAPRAWQQSARKRAHDKMQLR